MKKLMQPLGRWQPLARRFLRMKKFLIHREMLQRGFLQEFTAETEGKVIVVSHQWLSRLEQRWKTSGREATTIRTPTRSTSIR